jgi:tRNA(fMet)-specific endonuclease VapC
MSARYLLDTNILSNLIRQPQGHVARRIGLIGESHVCTSIIVACELRFGARKKNSPELTRRVEQLLDTIDVLPLDGDIDRVYADIRAALESAGQPIGGNDLLIAAHALSQDCVLVTDNEREFRRITELRIENWLSQLP